MSKKEWNSCFCFMNDASPGLCKQTEYTGWSAIMLCDSLWKGKDDRAAYNVLFITFGINQIVFGQQTTRLLG